jgi:putative Holliday junction resolvase
MSRILAIDYGSRRVGLAETDDHQIIASPLATVERREIFHFLENYLQQVKVSDLIVGQAYRHGGELSEIEEEILKFITRFEKQFPGIPVHRVNEAFTSKRAVEAMIQGGKGKKYRKEKGNVDKIAATLILQDFLETKRNHRI